MFVSVSHTEHMRRAWDAARSEVVIAKAIKRKERTFEEWLADEDRLAGPPIARL